jgi:hypothetical protein
VISVRQRSRNFLQIHHCEYRLEADRGSTDKQEGTKNIALVTLLVFDGPLNKDINIHYSNVHFHWRRLVSLLPWKGEEGAGHVV